MEEMLDEDHVVALEIVHCAAHAGKAFAEAKVVSGVVLGRLAFGPVPVSAVLNVHDINFMVVNDGPVSLEAQIVDATDALLENLRGHDGGTNRKNHAAVETLDRPAEKPKIDPRGAANRGTVEHRMIGNDVVADSRVN